MKSFIPIVGFFLAIAISSNAQKRGSSAGKTWSEDMVYYSFNTDPKNDTSRNGSSFMDFKEELVFGKWWIKIGGSRFFKQVEKHDDKNVNKLFQWAEFNDTLLLTNNLDLIGTGPGGVKFKGHFFFSDSLSEYFLKSKLNPQLHRLYIWRRIAEGFIKTSDGEQIEFSIRLNFNNPYDPINHSSKISIQGSSIVIHPIFNTDTTKKDITRGLYKGFELLRDEQVIAAARSGNDLAGNPRVYKYWFDANLDKSTTEVVVSTIAIIVKLF